MPLIAVTTLTERKTRETMRRKRSADEAAGELGDYAKAHGGRFILFGSYVSGTMRFDSDLDVLVDFPPGASADAWLFAEEVGVRHGLPLDIHDARTTKSVFIDHISAKGLVLE